MHTESSRGSKSVGDSSPKALLLSLTLGGLAVFFLLSILREASAVSAPQINPTLHNRTSRMSVSTSKTSSPTFHITKTVVPTHPDTGGVASICFTIKRPGLDVVLAQDVSGSMSGEKLKDSQDAASAFVDHLQSTDRAAVVSYSTVATLTQQLTSTKSTITRTIYDLTPILWTNIGAGISLSHRELITSPRFLSNTIKAVVLLSDGFANCDETSRCDNDPVTLAIAKDFAKKRATLAASDTIKIYTIGFNSDADEEVDEDLLDDIAEITGAKYFFAPDGDALETIYLSIALELHNLVITDVLPPGVETDCSQWEDGSCVKDSSGTTTITFHISDSSLLSDPVTCCFTAMVNLDPNYSGPLNDPTSRYCFDYSQRRPCRELDNPTVSVGGRKITGDVFYDLNANGHRETGEAGAPDVIVRTSTSLTTTTDASGNYVLHISREPPISIALAIPKGFLQTTPTAPISYHILPITGTYLHRDFGIHAMTYLPVVTKDFAKPSLHLSQKTVDKQTTYAGGRLRYSITLLNIGTLEPITGTVTDPIPMHTTFVPGSVTHGGWFDNNQIHWSSRLGPRDTHVIEFDVDIDDTICATAIDNVAVIEPVGSVSVVTTSVSSQVAGFWNCSFEEGWNPWMPGGNPSPSIVPCPDREGFCALLGDQGLGCKNDALQGASVVEQTIFLPPDGAPKLRFWYDIFTYDTNPDLEDGIDSFDVIVSGTLGFRDADKSGNFDFQCKEHEIKEVGWREGEVDLSAYKGKQITIRFKVRNTDNWYNTWTYLDDVVIAQ